MICESFLCSRRWRAVRIAVVFVGLAVACFVLSNSISRSHMLSQVFNINSGFGEGIDQIQLEIGLEKASMKDNKTVILTTLNEAWAKPHSIFDLFLESFRIGNNTQRLLNHLLVICLDDKAYHHCLTLHPHCYNLRTKLDFSSEAYFKALDYLEMMWRRLEVLAVVLDKGFNFVFTDTDVMWLRDPFPHFFPDADFQIACDVFSGNSYDVKNKPNGGFTYVKSDNRTIPFYKFWYYSRKWYPSDYHDQDVFNKIKYNKFIKKIGLQLRFLDTAYFGGFCEPSRDFNLVCTMHANCCVGQQNKAHDLQILLEDWRRFMSLDSTMLSNSSWSVPQDCR
ncbi:hypothetical protein FNV43_RR20921 [Rhamnella rubrinervis]|uniref:Nucleotide-diphospho-sugar transferase domain-containing protein n=1 Tax=Rhamnella rubrinervis TaxID=2594499 RepID=A0A8K0E2C9_9ROSA|nr:hypothetical protein FNV43_RR20921 [Rhamnella rubrinervis]